ncbi:MULTISPECIES: SDR family NAD(P)-dependent oxidoreductase [Burkholderia]|uniref:SDR family NAD(P)-dependent oxidoreductase n=1 Tax=Burkholderia TaxID=32008 RepID=UPI00075331BF|nr:MULTISPECIES: SDR family NAD(P)-dependent oxidoreductase [Burkholderia]KVM66267.1 3-oxoacyl-ACP reductase [Burkholderia gladioli]NBI50760.1 SDR family oxidoreductase [Burkholderia sp. ISTR5]
MNLQLEGKRCLVTGASSGIGRGIARLLAMEGVRLAVAGRDREALEALRADLVSIGAPQVVVCAGDLSRQDSLRHVASTAIEKLGQVDMLVNNAGASRPMEMLAREPGFDEDTAWAESMALNFDSARRLAALLTPRMKLRQWGRVVNLTGAVFAVPMNAATPAKAALQSWSKALAGELAASSITVNCVAPGRISSRQIDERLYPTSESRDAYIKANIPAGYFGEPEDVANVVAFLLSPLSRYITGSTIHVDGGLFRLAP